MTPEAPDPSSTPPHAQHSAYCRIIAAIDRAADLDFLTTKDQAEYVNLLRQQAEAWQELANSGDVPQWALLAAQMLANSHRADARESTAREAARVRAEDEAALDGLPDRQADNNPKRNER